jgi:hypothetical protein
MLAFMQNNSNASYSVGAGNFTTPGAKQVGVLLGIQIGFESRRKMFCGANKRTKRKARCIKMNELRS